MVWHANYKECSVESAPLSMGKDMHTYLNLLNTTQKSDLPREVAFLYIYILYLFSGAYSLPARRWDRAAEICAFFSPTMSYLNMGKMDSSASTPGKAV